MALGAAWVLAAAGAAGGDVRVRVENPPATGRVVALLFDRPDAFGDLRDPLRTAEVPVGGAAAFEDLPAGRYAVLAP